MGLFIKKPAPLNINEIDAIVRNYLKQKGDIELDALNEFSTEILAGTPQWTLVQIVENYLLAVFNPKVYKLLLNMDAQTGEGHLPPESDKSYGFCLNFFVFSLAIRNLPDEAVLEIMDMVTKASGEYSTHLTGVQGNLAILINALIPQIQIYELHEASANTDEELEDLIQRNVNDNNNLFNFYLSQRPDVAKLLV